jgi:hypothetical protein
MDACHCNSFNGGGGGGGQLQGVRKVDIGKEAILRAAAALSARDELGVVAFDESAHWVVQTKPLGQITDLEGTIAGINPLGTHEHLRGSGPGRQLAREGHRDPAATSSCSPTAGPAGQYDEDPAAHEGGRDHPLDRRCRRVARTRSSSSSPSRAAARFYAAANVASIPDIFLKETQQVAGQQIVEEPSSRSRPARRRSSAASRRACQAPRLQRHDDQVRGAAGARLARDDPILAQWQYGLGGSVAWTSDSTGRWAKNWVAWPGFTKFFSQSSAWTFPGEETRRHRGVVRGSLGG